MAKKNDTKNKKEETKEPDTKQEAAATQEEADVTAPAQPKAAREDECQKLTAELARLTTELAEEKDRTLRLAAEYDNFRKRTQKEKEASYGDAKAKTLAEILPVLDNFERAAQNSDATLEDYTKGVLMTFGQMMDILKKMGVEPFGEPGEPFDPQIHSAVMHIEDDGLDENVLAEVFQKGYRLGDRILRHAMVKVAN